MRALSFACLILTISCTSCASSYFEDFDTPVYEGVKNSSVTDLERNIVEVPGDKQDVLMSDNAKYINSMVENWKKENPELAGKSNVGVCWAFERPDGSLEVGSNRISSNEGTINASK